MAVDASAKPEMRRAGPVQAAALLACVTLFWVLAAFFGARSDIPVEELFRLLAVAVVIASLESLVFLLLPRWKAVSFALLAALNTYLCFGVLSYEVTSLPNVIEVGLFLLIGALYFVLYRLIEQRPLLRRFAGWSALAGVGAFGLIGFLVTAPGAFAGAVGDDEVTFDRHPNVYLLSFDALLPASLAQKYAGVADPAYLRVIERHGGQRLLNVFSDAVPTKAALSTIVKLQPGLPGGADAAVTGHMPTRLRNIFSHNGYETSFAFPVAYFGHEIGPFLDHYQYALSYSLCSFLSGRSRDMAFFGYCPLVAAAGLGPKSDAVTDRSDGYFTLPRIEALAAHQSDPPQLYMEHVLYPGHTGLEYQGTPDEQAAFAVQYGERSSTAAAIMDKMLSTILEKDRDAIVLIYGDHGAWTSRQVAFSENPEFYVQDRHGTLAALFNADECLPFVDSGTQSVTTVRVVLGLIQCLAREHPDMTKGFDYGTIHPVPNSERFDTYAYE